ncbi:MAG: extracellular solute-binding protein, partial [Oscillospiraceae bacterium]|nr:extracellular solute-binding protein [Oscillospiraceae bacterium]
MKRFLSVVFSVLLSAYAFSVLAFAENKDYSHLKGTTLNVYNWGEYISDGADGSLDVNKVFEERYGIKVNYTNFESNENMYNKLKSGGANYDVIIPSDYMIAKLAEEDMLAELDFSNIPNYKYIQEKYKNLYYDEDNRYSVPYTVGYT